MIGYIIRLTFAAIYFFMAVGLIIGMIKDKDKKDYRIYYIIFIIILLALAILLAIKW